MRHRRIKNWKETRSFLIRSPFDTYPSQTSNNQDFTICEMILCGNYRLPYRSRHRHRPAGEERDTAQHPPDARPEGVHTEAHRVRQDRQCHRTGPPATEREGGEGEDAHRHRLCPEKIQ